MVQWPLPTIPVDPTPFIMYLLKVMWPDRELNPEPPRSIPGALTTELYGQGYMAYLGGVDPSISLRTSEVRCWDYTTQQYFGLIDICSCWYYHVNENGDCHPDIQCYL